jgi:hypothetical protein
VLCSERGSLLNRAREITPMQGIKRSELKGLGSKRTWRRLVRLIRARWGVWPGPPAATAQTATTLGALLAAHSTYISWTDVR